MREAWPHLLPIAYGLSSLFGLSFLIRWLLRGGGWTIAQRIALVLLVGDIGGVLASFKPDYEREWISYQAGLVLVLVCVEQGRWLLKRAADSR